LIALGFILAYLCDIRIWQRVLIFLSTIPITVIMNSIRIGGIGVSVEYWGPQMAEGLLHDIEGWFMFMASLTVLLLELLLILRLSGDRRPLGQIFVLDTPDKSTPDKSTAMPELKVPNMRLLGVALTVFAAMTAYSLGQSRAEEIVPDRLDLNHFPLLVGAWQGTPDTLESIYIDALKFDDYMIANYKRGSDHLNFYIAWYGSQRSGQSAHSPRSCIPGGGWRIHSIDQMHLDDLYLGSRPLMTNRAVIQKGEARQVVYYWFQQRGRVVTNEYLVKWYLFVDALLHNRTDGALVRLTIPLGRGQSLQEADAQAGDFMRRILPRMNDFIPG
jgi:exosortase D (VPLPA-CTERM-specific)